MKRTGLLVVLVALFAGGLGAEVQRGRGDDWVMLGERTVTDRADHDTISVTAARGSFTALRFSVHERAVDFQRVVVSFANGDDQNIELRNSIPAGGTTRVIDINGGNRVIRKIDFWYDAKTLGRGGKAVVRAHGRR